MLANNTKFRYNRHNFPLYFIEPKTPKERHLWEKTMQATSREFARNCTEMKNIKHLLLSGSSLGEYSMYVIRHQHEKR